MPILRRNNCTNTASGILALLSGCTLPRVRADVFILKCALKLVEEIILYYDARSKKNIKIMLQTVWNKLDYRVDVCRITKGAHIEHL